MPYCASAPAVARLLLLPLPNVVVVLVIWVPAEQPTPKIWHQTESCWLFMSVVYVLPRVASRSWYVEPDWVTWSGTVPL